ncbi:tRNA 2-thiocytidine biosynthesis protein TtcA [Thermoplasmatales archaeon]|nr:tRNA 2-thiocytidine biosynthesis protein TtcA [Thermoplasmatales archaeon]
MQCSLCRGKAVYEARYNGTYLCRKHFNDSVERRFKHELRKQVDLKAAGIKISVAISGGKDSSVTLYLMNKFLGDRENVELTAFTIDEGIAGYRDSGLESARKLCDKLNVKHRTVSFEEVFGKTMDGIVKMDPETIPCSHCGPMRRKLMNLESLEYKSDYVALGINLDDYAQSILMNVVKGDFERMMRMAPHIKRKEGLVRRIVPLRRIPEKEVILYAVLNGVEFDGGWCPYYERAQRNTFRNIVSDLEEQNPGAGFAIANFLDEVREHITIGNGNTEMKKCTKCGAPTTGDLCSVCTSIGILDSMKDA